MNFSDANTMNFETVYSFLHRRAECINVVLEEGVGMGHSIVKRAEKES